MCGALCGALDRWFPRDDHPGLVKLVDFCVWSYFFVLYFLFQLCLEATGVAEAIGRFAFWVVAFWVA